MYPTKFPHDQKALTPVGQAGNLVLDIDILVRSWVNAEQILRSLKLYVDRSRGMSGCLLISTF